MQVETVMSLLSPLAELQPREFKMGIALLSICSGIGGVEEALRKLGVRLRKLVYVEIDDGCSAVSSNRHLSLIGACMDCQRTCMVVNSEQLHKDATLLYSFMSPLLFCLHFDSAKTRVSGRHSLKRSPSSETSIKSCRARIVFSWAH